MTDHCGAAPWWERWLDREDVVSDEDGTILFNYLQQSEADDTDSGTWGFPTSTDPSGITDG